MTTPGTPYRVCKTFSFRDASHSLNHKLPYLYPYPSSGTDHCLIGKWSDFYAQGTPPFLESAEAGLAPAPATVAPPPSKAL